MMVQSVWLVTGCHRHGLEAAGGAPDPNYPSDGMSIVPALTQNASSVPRTLFWRYKANHQRAARDGDWKILKMLDNTFLVNVADDPSNAQISSTAIAISTTAWSKSGAH